MFIAPQANQSPRSGGAQSNHLRMDKIKTILILLAVIIGSLAVLGTIGFIYSLLQYVLLIGVLCLAGYIGVRLLTNKRPKEIESSNPERQLKKAERTLEEYKRRLK